MSNEYRLLLDKLVEFLENASDCIAHASDCVAHEPSGNEFKSVACQLESLKLILDGNADALRLWMDEGGNYTRFQIRTSAPAIASAKH